VQASPCVPIHRQGTLRSHPVTARPDREILHAETPGTSKTMTMTDAPVTESRHLPFSFATLRLGAIAALILLIPHRIDLEATIDQHSPHLVGTGVQNTLIGPTDVLLVIVLIACLPLVFRRSTYNKQPLGQFGAAIFVVVVAIWLIRFPTLEGSMMLLRVTGVFGVVVAIRSMTQRDLMIGVVWPLTIGASLQALVALAQTFIYNTGMIVPATTLAQGRAWTAGRGTFSGSYALAAYLILAVAVALSFGISKHPRNTRFRSLQLSGPLRVSMWTAVVLSSAAVATTFGRTALLALGLVGASYFIGWLMRRQRIMGVSAAMTLLPLAVTGAFLRSGWLVRASQSAELDLTTRDALAARAIEMIRSSPLMGVGPVQYGPHLTQMGLTVLDPHVVHNVPLLVTAEFGMIVGLAFTGWLIALGIRAFRISVYATALFLSVIPFLLLDNLHYVYGNGMMIFAVWIAMLDYHWTAPRSSQDSTAASVPEPPSKS
jgi:hypothetical protein